MKLKRLVLAFAFVYAPIAASAWGLLGHRIVGEIAESYLTANAKKGVKSVLGNETLAMSANWPDFIKSDTTYKYMNPWHYVNLPADLSKDDCHKYLDSYPEANIYGQTKEMIALLKDPKTAPERKQFAMRVLVHLLGDMHQPMHTARKEDMGGNRIFVTWFGQKSNLHRVFDEDIIDHQKLSYTEYTKAINFVTPEVLKAWSNTNIKDMIADSYEVCNRIYASGIKNDDKLGYNFNFDWIATVNNQLVKGGVRLAAVLNEIYK